MSMEEDLARLVKAAVKAEVENHMRTRSSELIGRGGDVTIGGMGDIHIRTQGTHKAYYNGTEIGAGITLGSLGAVGGSGTANRLAKFTTSSNPGTIGNSSISDDGTNVTITLGSGGKLVVTS